MCEFKVFLKGQKIFEDAVYAKSISGAILLKNILGETMEWKDCQITEIDVRSERIVLMSNNPN